MVRKRKLLEENVLFFRMKKKKEEATSGFEPLYKVLQTSA